jgi:hypothetical protein
MKKCTGCGWTDNKPMGLNPNGEPYLACCPDNNYKELTAMQMMLDDLISKREVYENASMHQCVATLETSIEIAQFLLEKEKEQIANAYDRGYKACDLDEALEINKTMFSGERYYEQTYNQ